MDDPESERILQLKIETSKIEIGRMPARLAQLKGIRQDSSIRLTGRDAGTQTVGSDGRVRVTVPSLPRGCDVYLFNVIKVRSAESPFDHKALQIVRGPAVVKNLSLNDLARLPQDSEGYRVLRIPD